MSKVKNENLRIRCRFLRDSDSPDAEWLLWAARSEIDFEMGHYFGDSHDADTTDCCEIWVELDLEKLSSLLPGPFPVIKQ